MWHIYTMECYTAIKNDEFLSFVGTWMNLETIILSKLTQEQKIKHHMFSLIGGCWTMRTHGHREGSITHWGLSGGNRESPVGGAELGRESMGRSARYRWRGGRQQITLPCVYLCNSLACSSHVPQNLKCNKKAPQTFSNIKEIVLVRNHRNMNNVRKSLNGWHDCRWGGSY